MKRILELKIQTLRFIDFIISFSKLIGNNLGKQRNLVFFVLFLVYAVFWR